MPAKVIWNDDLDRALRDLIAEGANRETCSDAMGISWPVLRRRLRELGVTVTSSRDTRALTLSAIALVEKGFTPREAAEQVGTLPDTVRAAIRRQAHG